jgi:hypothetical protein
VAFTRDEHVDIGASRALHIRAHWRDCDPE